MVVTSLCIEMASVKGWDKLLPGGRAQWEHRGLEEQACWMCSKNSKGAGVWDGMSEGHGREVTWCGAEYTVVFTLSTAGKPLEVWTEAWHNLEFVLKNKKLPRCLYQGSYCSICCYAVPFILLKCKRTSTRKSFFDPTFNKKLSIMDRRPLAPLPFYWNLNVMPGISAAVLMPRSEGVLC